jgi:pimeloyl-[acyl-carrier protein] synthase
MTVTDHVGGVVISWGSSNLPDGSGTGPPLSQPGWEDAYLRLENSATTPGAVKPLYEVIAATSAFRPDGPLPIAIARFQYEVSQGQGPVEERETFFACGLLHDQWGLAQPTYRGHTVPFLVSEDFVLSNTGAPDGVELDPGDGGGFRPVTIGTPVVASYAPMASSAQVAVRCHYGSDVRLANFTMALSAQPAAPLPDETWPLKADNGNSGTAWVYHAHGASAIHRPIIMVEGFPGGHPADYLYDVLNQQGTATALRDAGRDIVIVGLDRGMDLIQRNADVLVECIREAIKRTSEPLLVGGMSMGGLISRYALMAMEARGEEHNTDTFLSIDTPHAGTYTTLGAQWFVHTYLPMLPALAGSAALLDSPANQQFDIYWVHDGAVQTSPLREELVRDLATLGDYPKKPRLLAISSGRGDGVRTAPAGAQTLAWSGEPWITAELHALADGAAGVIGSGTWYQADPPELPSLSFDAGVAWEGAPGGQEPYNGQVAAIAAGVGCGSVVHAYDSTCTVPTVSALDLKQDPFTPVPAPGSGASPFADYAFAGDNEEHLTITPEVSAWLLGALGATVDGWNPATFNPHDLAFLADPYPAYTRFRANFPIYPVPLYGSDWMFRYADCQTVLTGTDVWIKNVPGGSAPAYGPYGAMANFPEGLFASDPPLHKKLRGILEPLFDTAIQSAPALARQFAAPLLATAKQHGRMELIQDYALPLPSSVLFTLLGIPNAPGVWSGLITWQAAIAAAHDITQTPAVRGTGATCSMALNSYFEGMQLANKAEPMEGLFAQICDAFARAGLSPQEVQMCAIDFLVAGYLSTTFIIGTGVRNLLLNPDQMEALRKDPSLVGGALEEMLRMDGPVQVIDRYAAVDTEVGGHVYPKGSKVTAVVGSADHDPATFPDPETFNIQRSGEAHMAFGDGIHYCIGAPLVRLVGPVAIEMLINEFPDLALDGDPQWQTDPYLRAVTNLPLRF